MRDADATPTPPLCRTHANPIPRCNAAEIMEGA